MTRLQEILGDTELDLPAVDLIPLRLALFCPECEQISRGPRNVCPGCASSSLLSVAAVLNRETPE